MNRKIAFAGFGFILLLLIGGALWWLHRREKEEHLPKELFIPSDATVVVQLTKPVQLPDKLSALFSGEMHRYKHRMLYRLLDTLKQKKYVDASSLLVLRVEENQELHTLYLLSREGSIGRGDVRTFLDGVTIGKEVRERRVERQRVVTLTEGNEKACYVVAGGVVLLSDSETLVEDALRQAFDKTVVKTDDIPQFSQIRRYFSESASMNVFLNNGCFTSLLPMNLDKGNVPLYPDFSRWFKWGALDVDIKPEGMESNGFMHTCGALSSYPEVLYRQRPREGSLAAVLPEKTIAVDLLHLSDVQAYFSDLETYRANIGMTEALQKQKQERIRLFGQATENEWSELMQGELAKGISEYDPAKQKEEGVIVVHLKSGSLGQSLLDKMIAQYARISGNAVSSLKHEFKADRENTTSYYSFPARNYCEEVFGDAFGGMSVNYALIQDNYLVFASSKIVVQQFLRDYFRRSGVSDAEWYRKLSERMASKYNLMHLEEVPLRIPYYRRIFSGGWGEWLKGNMEKLEQVTAWGMQWTSEGEMLYQSAFICLEEVMKKRTQIVWQTRLDAEPVMKPAMVVNHQTKERELLVQDRLNNLYLINDDGGILWKQPLEGRINSEIYQVDAYKNGKLQYLFSTPTHLYLIDRKGERLPSYPLAFKSRCEVGITLYDYDNNKDYRVFVPANDQQLYLYELSGNMVKGWGIPKSDHPMVTKLYHYRVAGKDYLVYADQYRLYILDRRGNQRVKVDQLFNLSAPTILYLSKRNGKQVITFSDTTGEVHWVDFDGKRSSWKNEKISGSFNLNVGNVTGSIEDELIFTLDNRMDVYSMQGELIIEREWEGALTGYPYIYKFSSKDIRIGLLDSANEKLMLTDVQGDSKGFPIPGNTPFSIAFIEGEGGGFYLFAGATGDQLLKYRIER